MLILPPVTLLFVPGHQQRMLAKAQGLDADAIVFDLEDSVPPNQKQAASQAVRDILKDWPNSETVPLPYVRINPPRFGQLARDLAVIEANPQTGVVVPKVDRTLELAGLFDRIGIQERSVIVTIETPAALLRALEFAEMPGVDGLCLGGEDLAQAMGFQRTPSSAEFGIPRFLILAAGRAAGINVYDAICPEIRDHDILAQDARTASAAGFDGKFAIHPNQIPVIRAAFQPSASELETARNIVSAFDAALERGEGAVAVNGLMVDPPVAQRYRKMIERAGE